MSCALYTHRAGGRPLFCIRAFIIDRRAFISPKKSGQNCSLRESSRIKREVARVLFVSSARKSGTGEEKRCRRMSDPLSFFFVKSTTMYIARVETRSVQWLCVCMPKFRRVHVWVKSYNAMLHINNHTFNNAARKVYSTSTMNMSVNTSWELNCSHFFPVAHKREQAENWERCRRWGMPWRTVTQFSCGLTTRRIIFACYRGGEQTNCPLCDHGRSMSAPAAFNICQPRGTLCQTIVNTHQLGQTWEQVEKRPLVTLGHVPVCPEFKWSPLKRTINGMIRPMMERVCPAGGQWSGHQRSVTGATAARCAACSARNSINSRARRLRH